MSDPINVLIALPEVIADDLLGPVQALSPRLHVEACQARSVAEVSSQLLATEVLLTNLKMPTIEQAPRLRWVQTYFAGVDQWIPSARDRLHAVVVTTASGVHGPNMAEYSLLMLLAFAHLLPETMALQARREWPA